MRGFIVFTVTEARKAVKEYFAPLVHPVWGPVIVACAMVIAAIAASQ